MKKQLNTLVFLWLCSAVVVSAQSKAESFPEFINIDDSEAQAERGSLFQAHYKMGATDELRPTKTETDEIGFTHEKFQQFYKGVKVESATSTLHSKDGRATMLTGNYHRISGLEVVPKITAEKAFLAAEAHVNARKYQWDIPLSEHNDYQKPTGELVVVLDFFVKTPPRLAYKFDIYAMEPLYRADVYIDAMTGEYLSENLKIHHANVPATGNSLYDGNVSFTAENTGPFRLRQTSSGGGVQTFNLNNGSNYGAATDFTSATTNFTSDAVGVEAHWASERTWDYFFTNHGRNSYNNAGAILKSYVHYSVNYFNAFWDGSRMTYGDGCCGATALVTLDICGHEVAHGVTQFTAGLIYAGQSGALNESFSDIFGEAIENWGKGSNDWELGDEIGVLIRDMANPNVTSCPDTYLGTFWDPAQEVHTNSGVQNKWFYVLTDGENGTNDNGQQYCVTGIGLDAAGKIAYRNLSVYLSASSNYAAARTGAINAARDLYGIGSQEEVSTTNAWYAVGVGGPYTPAITCPPNIVTTNTTNLCSKVVTYATPAAQANCPTVTRTTGFASGASFPVGTTINTYRVTDAVGTTATCSFTIKVDDTQKPVITCPGNQLLNCQTSLPAYSGTVTDNCPGPYTQSQSPPAGSVLSGITTITLTATDAYGNTNSCSFTVTPNDVTPPVITCPANVIKNNDLGLCGANVSYPTPTATDNCGIGSIVQLSGLASGAYNPVGATINVWRATDLAGNSSTCSFTVTVIDTEKPVATCPPDRSVNNDPGKCSAALNINGGLALADNCGIASTSNNAASPYSVGETVITWTAKDPSGNAGTCSFKVTVRDAEPPTVHCPTNINTLTDLGDCGARVNFNATASDNCGVAYTDLSDPSGSTFPVGWTNISFSATDVNGNVSNCAFQIIVNTRAETCNDLDDDCDGWVDEAEDWDALMKRYASDGVAAEEYGLSVGIDGDYAIVGSNQKNGNGQNVGSAYILSRDKGGANKWGQILELTPPSSLPGDNFGASVAISGGIAAVGAPLFDDQFGNQGVVFLFHQNANNPELWDFVKTIQASNPNSADNFGTSVALQGDRLVAGAHLDDQSGNNAGAAYVFYRNLGGADQWGQAAKLLATTGAADDNMGVSVGIDGDYAIVGASGVEGLMPNVGAAYIFGRNTTGPDAWGQVAKLRPIQASGNDNFGAKVGISGPWAIVGADGNDLKGADAGAAYIFYKNQNGINNSWGQRQLLLDYNGHAGDHFGSAVGIDEPYAVVAAKGDNPFGAGSGRGFVYLLDGSAWIQVDELADGGGQAGDALGSSAAISGRNIILGAQFDNNGLNDDQGSVTVYGGLCNANLDAGGDNRNDLGTNAFETSVHCYPVPFSDVLNIDVKGIRSAVAQLTIVNAMGQIVSELYKGSIESDMLFQWQPTQAADGLYFLRMNTGEKVLTQAIVRTR
ncbi:MAG: HYR domain-containing protein [Phycisphaerae bacterium]|nr:HYR domain-containing protein [Saprospiraceae bacterium]